MEQLRLFDMEEQDLEKQPVYYYEKGTIWQHIMDGYGYRFIYEEKTEKGIDRMERNIALLHDNLVFNERFIYKYKTNREAVKYVMDTYNYMMNLFKNHPKKYHIIELNNKPLNKNNLFLVNDPVKYIENTLIYSESWYSGLNGYFFNLKLPYDEKMDRTGKILYQLDEIKRVAYYVNRDFNGKHDYIAYYQDINYLLTRVDYLYNELGYEDKEVLNWFPDIDQLRGMYNEWKQKRQIELSKGNDTIHVSDKVSDDVMEMEEDEPELEI